MVGGVFAGPAAPGRYMRIDVRVGGLRGHENHEKQRERGQTGYGDAPVGDYRAKRFPYGGNHDATSSPLAARVTLTVVDAPSSRVKVVTLLLAA